MIVRRLCCLPGVLVTLTASLTEAQPADDRAASGIAELDSIDLSNRSTTIALRTSQPPVIDGRLDDPVWLDTTPITRFIQTSPVEGAAATEATEVWITYDSDNVYVAFYAHYANLGIIRANRRRWGC